MSFYAIISGIALAAFAMILEIWDVMDDVLRNRILLTLVVLVGAVLAASFTNLLYASADEEVSELPGDEPRSRIGDSLRKAKSKRDGNPDA